MKITLVFEDEIPFFLFTDAQFFITVCVEKQREISCWLDWISPEPVENTGDIRQILFDGTLEKYASVRWHKQLIMVEQPLQSLPKTEDAIHEFYCEIPSVYRDCLEQERINQYLKSPKGKKILLELTLSREMLEYDIFIQEGNTVNTVHCMTLRNDPKLKGARDKENRIRKNFDKNPCSPFVLTGEPMSTRAQCLYSGTLFNGIHRLGRIPVERTQQIPLLFSKNNKGENFVVNLAEDIVEVSYETMKGYHPIKIRDGNKDVFLLANQTFLTFEELPIVPNVKTNAIAVFQAMQNRKTGYKDFPVYLLPWVKNIQQRKINLPFKMGEVNKLNTVLNKDHFKRLYPNYFLCPLQKKIVTENKFKIPLPIDISSVLPVVAMQELLPERIIDKMTLETILDMYKFHNVPYQKILNEVEIDPSHTDRTIIKRLVYGKNKNKTTLYKHFRDSITDKENLPDLYYEDL